MGRLILGLVVVLSSETVFGALVVWDWQTPGDRLVTYDTETRLEWLDWTASTAHSYDDMIPKLNPGGEYHGFRYATSGEVSTLFNHAHLRYAATHNWYESPRTGVFGQLIELLGETSTVGDDRYATAILPATTDIAGLQHRLQVSDVYSGDYGRAQQSLYSVDRSQSSSDMGHALVRSRSPFGPDADPGTAEALYDQCTGELFFDVGSGVAVIGIYSAVMYPGNVDEGSIFGAPVAASSTTIAWFAPGGLPVGEDSVGMVLPAGLGQDDMTFSYGPIGQPNAYVDVTIVHSIDFDGGGNVDVVDLNLLTAAGDLTVGVALSSVNAQFDLNGDNIVDSADLDRWLVLAATINGYDSPYLKGDTNLNGEVDVWEPDGTGDAQVLSSNLNTMTGMVWGDGDFNGDGDVDVWEPAGLGDAQLLSTNMLATNDIGAATVPEPSTLALLAMGAIGLLTYTRRRRWSA